MTNSSSGGEKCGLPSRRRMYLTLPDRNSRRRVVVSVALAVMFRFACYSAMMAFCLWAERRPAPSLPDLVMDHVPYVGWIDRWNTWLLAACYLPPSLALLFWSPQRFCEYNVTSGMLSIARGSCIVLTGLGPVQRPDVNAGVAVETLRGAFFELINPVALFLRDSPRIYLTKDLFFSGHVGVTFLLLLYVWPNPKLRITMLVGHLITLAAVVFSHLHYSIDIVGAYAIAYSLFTLRRGSRLAQVPHAG